MTDQTTQRCEIPAAELRWACTEDWLPFSATTDVEPVQGVVGQDDAVESLRFGLEFNAPGQNVYVRGLTGTGRATLVEQLLHDILPPCPPADDRCYVHNFVEPDQPRLLSLPRGTGMSLQAQMDELIAFIEEGLGPALNSDTVRVRRAATDDRAQKAMRELGKPFEDELRANDLALVPIQLGQTVQPTILPVVDGKPVSLEEFQQLAAGNPGMAGRIEAVQEQILDFARKFENVNQKIAEIQRDYRKTLKEFYETEARRLLQFHMTRIEQLFESEDVRAFLRDVVNDLVEHRLETLAQSTDFTRLYRVNPILTHAPEAPCPVIKETSPTLQNLLGNIDREVSAVGAVRSDHLMVHAGSLLRADGGYLVLEARDLLSEPGAWKILVRTLKTGQLEIVPSELSYFWSGPMLKPEPIPLNVKVVLIGEPGLYQMLDAHDPDFAYLFKVLADFETTIARDQSSALYYAGVLARITQDENLLPFDQSGVAAIAEHGARIAGRKGRLTTRFGRLTDVAREAGYLAAKASKSSVAREDVYAAVARGRRRADLPARNYRKYITEGTIRIATEGQQVGQINGLAVIQAGPLTYGFPSRITASIGAGTAGTVNIEREAELSGSIHTKGFYILGGLLRNLLRTTHPLAFSASIAFEQSYGGIDGDSASGAEMVCLLSALTGMPLRQDLAMTGAIDQIGHVQPIGAVTEKIEGFYEVCRDLGLTGTQGVVIPRTNAGDLMLNPELLDVCKAGEFHVYAVDTIHDALAIFTGCTIGEADAEGRYPKDSFLDLAQRKAFEYWRMATDSKKDVSGQ